MKTCSKCSEDKEISLFPKNGAVCKSCKGKYHKEYAIRNKEKLKEYIKEYYKEYKKDNKELIKENSKIYYEENKEKIKEYQNKWIIENKYKKDRYNKEYREINRDTIKMRNKNWRDKNENYYNIYFKKRCEVDSLFKLTGRLRCLIRNSIIYSGYTKRSKTPEIFGCSFSEFKLYLESKFEYWMTWNNYGLYNGELNYGWDIDHVIPLSSVNSEDEIIKLNHFSNLQPLCSKVNRDIKRNIF